MKYWSQDEQISKFCVFASKMRCSFKRKRPCTYKGRLLFWIHHGRRHPEQRHGDPDTFLPKCRIWYLRNRERLISLSSQVRLLLILVRMSGISLRTFRMKFFTPANVNWHKQMLSFTGIAKIQQNPYNMMTRYLVSYL